MTITAKLRDERFTLTQQSIKAVEYFKQKLCFEISPYELSIQMKKENLQLVDIRPREDYADFHIKGAISIPFEELQERIHELSKNKINILYSTDGFCNKTNLAGLMLAINGYPVMTLLGGFKAWNQKDYPTKKSVICSSIFN